MCVGFISIRVSGTVTNEVMLKKQVINRFGNG